MRIWKMWARLEETLCGSFLRDRERKGDRRCCCQLRGINVEREGAEMLLLGRSCSLKRDVERETGALTSSS